jgi:pyruvate/2-oxoglutarate dehydrogenase complex dihydrolipoamide dehydrogenase (E3) component
MDKFDVIIIGAGQAGNPLSTTFAGAKKKIALIEEKFVGGTCINVGCTPTKTMIASAEMAALSRRLSDYGVQSGNILVDIRKIRQRKDSIVSSFRRGSEKRIEESDVSLIYGHAAFLGPKTVEVILNEGGTRQLTAETIIINSGSRPRIPVIDGLNEIPFLNSSSIMEIETIPNHLLILGGGYVAVEFGQMFRRFGSRVTIIQHSSQLIGREDGDVAQALLEVLQEDGIDVLLNTDPIAVSCGSSAEISLQVNTPQGKQTFVGSHLLVAVGRTPNSDTLNLPAAGIDVDQNGYIRVNDHLETNVSGIFAVGDVKGGPAFTHIAYDDFRILRSNLLEDGNASTKGRFVPYVLFTDPQLGRIGCTETEARKAGLKFQVVKMPMTYVARAIEIDKTCGFLKALVETDSKQILGAAFLGVEGGELMSMVEIAMMGKVPYPILRDAIFAHPTLAESLNNLFAELP